MMPKLAIWRVGLQAKISDLYRTSYTFTAQENLGGIAGFIDFEKAFDSFECDFLLQTPDTFQFGHEFRLELKFCAHITSCAINNDYASNWFELHRGVRQDFLLSGLLLVLGVEKLSQYADDTTVFYKEVSSLEKLLDLLDTLGGCSGLKLNVRQRKYAQAMIITQVDCVKTWIELTSAKYTCHLYKPRNFIYPVSQ